MQRVEVRSANGFAGLFVVADVAAGSVVVPIVGVVEGAPSRYSLQVSECEHIVPPIEAMISAPEAENYRWCFTNHGCEPNVRVDTARRALVALRDLHAGDEVVFDYNSTEWSMAEPFACRCGASRCYGVVQGYRHLSPEQQARLAPIAAPHLRALSAQIVVA